MSEKLNPAEKLKEAREFAVGRTEAEFLLVRKQGDTPNVGKLQLGRPVQQEIAQTVADALTEQIDNLRDGRTRARPLDVANTISEESVIQCVRIENLPDSELFEVLNSRDNDGTTTYSEDPEPDFQLIRISEPDGKVLIGVQNYSNAKLVDTTSELTLWYQNEEYERFQGDLLVIRPNLNAICYDGWVFIITPKSFESMFDMREEYRKRAEEAIEAFEDAGITFVDRETTIGWMLSHINMLRGMYEIYDNGIHEEATPDKIEAMIQKYDLDTRFSLDYARRNGQIELGVDEYQHTWKLIKLLAAKYAEDDIMGEQWEIDSGQRL